MFSALVVRIANTYTKWARQYRVMDKRGLHWGFTRTEWSAKAQASLVGGTWYRWEDKNIYRRVR